MAGHEKLPAGSIQWDELVGLVMYYPVDPGRTVSHASMLELWRLGYAVRDGAQHWIPTAQAVERYLAGPVQGDRGVR